MKILKMINMKASLLALLFGGLFLVAGCSSSDDPDPVAPTIDKSALITLNNSTEILLNNAVEGSAEGQYILGSKAPLQEVLDASESLEANQAATQQQVNAMIANLNAAIATFNTQKVTAIDPANLVAQWTFDEGAGTTVKDYSTTGANGTFGSAVAGLGGPTANSTGTAMPTWTTDRYGNANKALAFNNGAKIMLPENAKLNPAKITISLWVNAAEINGSNRFMGLNSWMGYKFQLQDSNKPFFTGSTVADGIFDRDDAEGILEINKWYNIAVAVGDGHTIFYINGVMVKDWDNTPGTLKTVSGQSLAIGVDASVYAETEAEGTANNQIFKEWGGYFRGSLDDIRIYKTVLSAAQVKSIYDVEKPAN